MCIRDRVVTGGQGDGETLRQGSGQARGQGDKEKGGEYQGYDLVDEDGKLVDAVGLFVEKYGYRPARVMVTGGAVLAGPIVG